MAQTEKVLKSCRPSSATTPCLSWKTDKSGELLTRRRPPTWTPRWVPGIRSDSGGISSLASSSCESCGGFAASAASAFAAQ